MMIFVHCLSLSLLLPCLNGINNSELLSSIYNIQYTHKFIDAVDYSLNRVTIFLIFVAVISVS